MAEKEEAAAANRTGPINGTAYSNSTTKINKGTVAIATTGATQAIDLDGFFGSARYKGAFLRIKCNQTLYYFYSASSSETVDETASTTTNANGTPNAMTNGGRQCDSLEANESREEIPPARYLHVKAAVGILRLSITNPTANLPDV